MGDHLNNNGSSVSVSATNTTNSSYILSDITHEPPSKKLKTSDDSTDSFINNNFFSSLPEDLSQLNNVEEDSVSSNNNNNNANNIAEDSVDITISNVVTNFSVRCHLNLRTIATNGSNVVYRRDQSIILMKLRQPQVTASIWSSGKITCTGATTEEQAKSASRRVARVLQKMGFRVRFSAYRIVNVLGSCRLPFGIKIHEFSDVHRRLASYEPELHPGATYRIKELKAVLKIFQTGSITITAPSVTNVQLAVEHIYPLVYEFRKPKPPRADGSLYPPLGNNNHRQHPNHFDDEADHGDALLYDKLIIDEEGEEAPSSSDSE